MFGWWFSIVVQNTEFGRQTWLESKPCYLPNPCQSTSLILSFVIYKMGPVAVFVQQHCSVD